MIKELTCIECPKSCRISVDIQDDKIVSIKGFKCKKGEAYAREEVLSPMRILTATVIAEGLQLKLIPARTDKPIPKTKLFDAMQSIQNIVIDHRVKAGDVIKKDFMLKGVNLVSTRDVETAI